MTEAAGPLARSLPPNWDNLAAADRSAVNSRFSYSPLWLPGTQIGAISHPAPTSPAPWNEWHYWWQAHYLDAVVDSGFRALRMGSHVTALSSVRQARALLRGILLRNFGRFPNHFYDDMAWLALATGRLNDLVRAANLAGPARGAGPATGRIGSLSQRPGFLSMVASSTLTHQLACAHDGVLGGGIYWSKKRDYKNTPANGPTALHFARIGEMERAQAIVDWLRRELFDPTIGLYLDGIHPSAAPTTAVKDIERTIYTYNQGPILAALLQLDHPRYAHQAAELVDAVARELEVTEGGLRLEAGGDGNLFTGILCRYMALAALDRRLPERTRGVAQRLVVNTAKGLVGIPEPTTLSAALQRWIVFEAAATCSKTSRAA
ncbi:glycoside hydrolase family 76 protein [Arthrobacter cryoconiti]|uniref:Glycoside hydrolase family 76 protein n=1 Tax=Arthrobacter cryoconiti TaxID=748907 RepID=A0ABV8QXN2_9MICC|nr:glycoside hydrolase family 76 protein [Arthrobacter cryoconiti]MCC9067670.1 glycosyl hydrolase [Arthrobacter cryoconiti]